MIHGLARNYLCEQVLTEINLYSTRKTGELNVLVPFHTMNFLKGLFNMMVLWCGTAYHNF